MSSPEIALSVARGKTFEFAFLYAEESLVYKPILAVASLAPLRLTVPNHGLPSQWPVRISGVSAPVEMNQTDLIYATAIDPDTVELNTVDGSGWAAFEVSGNLVFNKPVDLTGWSARAAAKDRVGGTLLLSWHSNPAETPDGVIEVDEARSAFVVTLSANKTAALDWQKGVWELEAIDPQNKVWSVVAVSRITVIGEVVT